MPTIEELQFNYHAVLKHYDDKLVAMKEKCAIDMNQARSLNVPFTERKIFLDKNIWIDKQREKIKKSVMPPVGEWVDSFPVGEWGTNGQTKQQNIYEFIIKRFELCYLQM